MADETRHRSSFSTTRLKPAFIAVPVVVLVLGMAAYLLFFRGSSGSGGILGGHTGEAVPTFAFKLTKTVPVPAGDQKQAQLTKPADQAAKSAARTLDGLYTEAFLNPANRRDGSYEGVFAMFTKDARTTATADQQVLTAGSAGTGYDTVTPLPSTAHAKVLVGKDNKPISVVMNVRFSARAEQGSSSTQLVSTGQYFLQPTGGAWHIVSYDVTRGDKPLKASAGPSPSGTSG